MNVIQSYQQGARHKANDQPCEDRTYSLNKNGVYAIALADGAGSQKYTHSADGAECVTKVICNFLCDNFEKILQENDINKLKNVFEYVCQKKLCELAKELELDSVMRLSSTLLAVAVKNDYAVICHIGDGVIGKLSNEGCAIVSAPDNGEYANTTFFITSQNANEHINIKIEKLNDTIAYFLMSDGVSEYIYNECNNEFSSAAKKMALMANIKNGQEELEKTIRNFMIERDKCSDDCSFICLSLDNLEQAVIQDKICEPKSNVKDEVQKEKANTIPPIKQNTVKTTFTKKEKYILVVSVIVAITAVVFTATKTFYKKPEKPKVSISVESTTVESTTKEINRRSSRDNTVMKDRESKTSTSRGIVLS